ncbi:MAG: hypothetical protein JXQ73_33900, partial [Phycisphaerae bacterium]|nr:hypothetical protein [Phycisphaerae bacterium]
SLWEHFNNMGGWNKTHETGWFLCQTRIMLVMERADELWLAPFVTTHWLEDGMIVSLGDAPTRFGKVSYSIKSSVSQGHIDAVIEPPTRSMPKALVLRLRHPEGKRFAAVFVDGKPHDDVDVEASTIRLSPSEKTITVRASY